MATQAWIRPIVTASAIAGIIGPLPIPHAMKKSCLLRMDASPSTSPEAFAGEIRAEAPTWERVIREYGAKVD